MIYTEVTIVKLVDLDGVSAVSASLLVQVGTACPCFD